MKKLITVLILFLSAYSFAQRAHTGVGGGGGGSMLYPNGVGITTVNNGSWGITIPYFSAGTISYFNQGLNANATSFWAGDGTWKPLPSFNTNLSFLNNTSPILLNSSTGNGVAFKAGTNITLSKTSGAIDTLIINSTGGGGGGSGTVTSVAMTTPTGLTVSGSPITTSGTLGLTYTDGYSIPTTANQGLWTTAYNDRITSMSITGTDVKTVTLNQTDGGIISASFTDMTSGGGTGGSNNSSMSWDNSTNTVSVTDGAGTVSTVITGFLESEADGDPANELNSSVGWNDALNILSVTDAGGAKSAIITGFLESEQDGNPVNELQSLSVADNTVSLSQSGGSFTLAGSGGTTVSTSGTTITINSTGGGGGSMVYPEAGIALSTGTGWGISIIDNSADWNDAYSWGNHAAAGYLKAEADGNPTNEAQTLETTVGTNPTMSLSEVSGQGGGGVRFVGGGITSVSYANGDITFTSTEIGDVQMGGDYYENQFVPLMTKSTGNVIRPIPGVTVKPNGLQVATSGSYTSLGVNNGNINAVLSTDGGTSLYCAVGSNIIWDTPDAGATFRITKPASAPTLTVNDEAYGASWDGSMQVPTKNALYDKIESLGSGGGATPPAGINTQVQYNNNGSFGASADFTYDNTNRYLRVGATQGVGIVYSSNFILTSDKRLKTEINSLKNLNWVDKVEFKQFKFKSKPEQLRYGVIAQDLEEINKELVFTDEKGYKGVSYIDLLVAKVARQDEIIKSLIERIEKLEKQ